MADVVREQHRCHVLRQQVLACRQPAVDQGRRQVKICGVDRHGERVARAYNGGLEAESPAGSRGRAPGQGVRGRSPPKAENLLASGCATEAADPLPLPCKNLSDLYQFQERPLAKVGWTCPPESTPCMATPLMYRSLYAALVRRSPHGENPLVSRGTGILPTDACLRWRDATESVSSA